MNILNKLTIKHLKMNKKRTIVTIIGVVLSTALMVGIGLLFSSIRDNSIKMVIQDRGSQHVTITSVDEKKMDILNHNKKIKKVWSTSFLGFAKASSKNEYKPYLAVMSSSEDFFKTLHLREGRFPQNSGEILLPQHLLNNMDHPYQIGDTITLEMINRLFDGEVIKTNQEYSEEETIEPIENVTYQVVGIVDRPYIEAYSAAGYTCFTTGVPTSPFTAYVTYKTTKDVYKTTETLAEQLGFQNVLEGGSSKWFEEIRYNDSLLALYGQSNYSNFISSIASTIMIILTLISIGCIIVIYNSFAISVMERKKQFGLFSSIGATKKQLRKTVFFEAFLIGIIGIPIGILGGFVGIGCVIEIINLLLPDIFGVPLALAAYPTFLIIPLIFMVIVIILSAYLPAKQASKITPIEAIRQNDDIKIKSKKVKTRKWVRSFFGVEGELALKNIKRNKKKYRITVVSLFISIVLFVSFSGLLEYGIRSTKDYTELPDYDLSVSFYGDGVSELQNFKKTIEANEQTKAYHIYSGFDGGRQMVTEDLKVSYYSEVYKKYFLSSDPSLSVQIITMDDASFEAYQKSVGASSNQPIIINQYRGIEYRNGSRVSLKIPMFTSLPKEITACRYQYQEENDRGDYSLCDVKIQNYVMTEEVPFGLESYLNNHSLIVVINQEMEKLYPFNENESAIIYVQAPKNKELNKELKTLVEASSNIRSINYFNVQEDLKLVNNMYLVIQILLYGFIALVTLIGVTSVFNTINTSISLRRKEFAMLRSMGLTPRGFNKILYLESVFFGIKSLLYGLPVSIGVIYLLGRSFNSIVPRDHLLIPWTSILVAVVGVFLIVLATMMYASKKMKRENILNAIREENI